MNARRALRHEGGAAAVEFAVASPAIFLLLIGTVEAAVLLIVALSLGDATLEAARYGATGFGADAAAREAEIRRIISSRTLGLARAEGLRIDSVAFSVRDASGALKTNAEGVPLTSFDMLAVALEDEWLEDTNGNGQWDVGEWFDDLNGDGVWQGGGGASGPGRASDIVVYRIAYDWTPMVLPQFAPITLRAVAPVRNEPF
jgi:hypothetical protein